MPDISDPGPVVTGSPIGEALLPVGKQRRLFDKGPHMAQMIHKRGEDTLDWFIDLLRWLEPNESITSCTAQRQTGDLTIQRLQFAPTGALVWLTGGTDGVRHSVNVLVTTSRASVKLIRFSVLTRGSGAAIPPPLPVISIDSVTVIIPAGGVAPAPGPSATFGAASMSFGTIPDGSVGDLILTVTNTGTAPLIISAASATGDFSVIGIS